MAESQDFPAAILSIYHPLCIQPSDVPGAKLVTNLLEGSNNYASWRQSMILSLEAKSKLVLIDGTFKVPSENDPLFPIWKRCNSLVKSWLISSESSSRTGVLFNAKSKLELQGYCDSDWASCPMTRRLTSGYCTMLGTSALSWKTKKQHTVSRSSAEAEYRAMAELTCELVWLSRVLDDLGVVLSFPIRMFCDNQAALYIVRDKIKECFLITAHVHSKDQAADLCTKALNKHQHHHLSGKLGVLNLFQNSSLRGCVKNND